MKKKKITVRTIVQQTGLSSATVNRARQDEGIAECRLSTLAKLGAALGVKTKRLYDETDGTEQAPEAQQADCPAGEGKTITTINPDSKNRP